MGCTEVRFLKDVAEHQMEVIRDDGVYRHIRFKKPGTSCMHFDLITWPGYLCYTGDMGTFVFSRLNDMFEFFRTDREHITLREGQTLAINRSYWAEKVEAKNRHDGIEEFSEERFKRVINKYRVRWVRESGLTKEQRRELWEAVDEDVLDYIDEGEHVVYARANDFYWSAGRFLPGNHPSYEFEDLWDHDFKDYTYRFDWCCYALAWGIEQYDRSKGTLE